MILGCQEGVRPAGRGHDDKSLVLVGTFDIVDPVNITSSVKDYVARIIAQLERENLIAEL